MARDLTVGAGDVLAVLRIGAQWVAVARMFTAAITDPPPIIAAPNPTEVVRTGTLVVSPVDTGSYRASFGWRTDNTDVSQGDDGRGNHTGAVFYGDAPRSLTGATVTGATVQVQRIQGGTFTAQATTMRLMTESTKPGGTPTLTSTTAGPSLAVDTETIFTVPNSWAQAMVNGTAGGIAFFDSDGSPFVRFAGRGSWSPAFTLAITWQRG
ncbi:hypothetical protein [Micromonospora sp. C81]|uniref:hypothetical protein n=1 Tax=Micromonospora sp. C81 TaxID=2824881 RepID=UPI001B39323F|nr:hypothetical protein [Micromonospora sp. C81]MBQ1039284.1 hypothetical protein [Micromonospora sp. C81]